MLEVPQEAFNVDREDANRATVRGRKAAGRRRDGFASGKIELNANIKRLTKHND